MKRYHFNPRTPRGGATDIGLKKVFELIFQSTHPTRGCDFDSLGYFHQNVHISIHAPHEGVRRKQWRNTATTWIFQSTHPTRGCDRVMFRRVREFCISIHAPHEGVRHAEHGKPKRIRYFNPRTPRGGATVLDGGDPVGLIISIHAPHEGVRRTLHTFMRTTSGYFNPRTPRGGATDCRERVNVHLLFQSTHPTRGCDHVAEEIRRVEEISIHAPHEGVRRAAPVPCLSREAFQSTHPTRGCDQCCIIID